MSDTPSKIILGKSTESLAVVTGNSLDLAYQFSKLCPQQSRAIFKAQAQDFFVEEPLAFELDGEGEHLYLQVKKTMCTTLDLQRALASWARVDVRQVAYSGLKDKWAQTIQWFSIQLPGKDDPDISAFNFRECQILQAKRHYKKLRIGVHKKNNFVIRLREVEDMQLLRENLLLLQKEGVPNYFGEQRFGISRNNLNAAFSCLIGGRKSKRQERGLYLSAVRSYLFNTYLSERIKNDSWNQYVDGDVLQLNGSHSCFIPEFWDETLNQRLLENDIYITGPMPGFEGLQALSHSCAFETEILSNHQMWLDYLKQAKIKSLRRSLKLTLGELEWQELATDEIELSFSLPAGSFATAVLRELIQVTEPTSYQML